VSKIHARGIANGFPCSGAWEKKEMERSDLGRAIRYKVGDLSLLVKFVVFPFKEAVDHDGASALVQLLPRGETHTEQSRCFTGGNTFKIYAHKKPWYAPQRGMTSDADECCKGLGRMMGSTTPEWPGGADAKYSPAACESTQGCLSERLSWGCRKISRPARPSRPLCRTERGPTAWS
jgi:hypothetical protein